MVHPAFASKDAPADMAAISFRCREARTDPRGEAPIDLRISHQGERKFISTNLRVDPEKWRDGEVTRSHHQASEINAALRRLESTAQKALTKLRTSNVQITAARVKTAVEEALNPEPPDDERVGFADFCKERIKRMYDNEGTQAAHRSAVTKLQAFLRQTRGVDDVPLSPQYVTAALLEEMQAWESTERENSVNTIHKTMRTLRRMINVAIRDDLFPREAYPFDDLTLERERTEKIPLTAGQVESLEELLEDINDGAAGFHRDGLPAHSLRCFLFAVYMLGMRWSDASSLEWSQVRDGRIKYQMRKTGAHKDLKVVPPARKILDIYESRRSCQFVFPFMERYGDEYDLSNDAGMRQTIRAANRRVNQELKEIADAAGVDVNLSTHIARHTSAQRMMDNGWSLQEINAGLGHSTMQATEHYLQSIEDTDLDDQHKDLF